MVTYEMVIVGALFGGFILYVLGSLGLIKRMGETDYDEENVPRKPNERGITYIVRSALYLSYHGIIAIFLFFVIVAAIIYKILNWLFRKPDGGHSE